MKKTRSITALAARIAISYVLAGGLWILLSDRLLSRAAADIDTLTALQTYKGWLFVALSGLLIYGTSRRYLSQLVQAGSRLTESQRAMLTLQGNLPGTVYRCENDRDWTMRFVSKGVLELTGYRSDEIAGNSAVIYGQLVVPEDKDMVREEVHRAISGKAPFQLEYRIKTKDGREKWVCEQGCGVFSDDGELRALEGYIFDITEKKRLEEKLRTSERLQHVGQAASTIIHDLKNQMQVVLGHVELLRGKVKGTAENHHCDIIEARVHTMVSMGRELLDYARGQVSLEVAATNVQDLLQELVDTYQPTFQRQGVHLSLTLRQEQDTSPLFELDRERVWRALMNLIGNAKEVLGPGSQIRLRSWIARDELRIEVQDDGPGIPKSIQESIFEPFVTHGKSGGTGLGLAIVKTIVEAHQGTIAFTSSTGAGTTFAITLPRRSVAGIASIAKAVSSSA